VSAAFEAAYARSSWAPILRSLRPQRRYELVRAATPTASASGGESRPVIEHPILLDPAEQYLMRCDRVDFDFGGEALPHRRA